MRNETYLDPKVIDMAVAAADLTERYPVAHPVRMLLTQEHPWLGGIAEVRDWFRTMSIAYGDQLDAAFAAGRLPENAPMPMNEISALLEAFRDEFPSHVFVGSRRAVEPHALLWRAVRDIKEIGTLPHSVDHERTAASHRFLEVAALLIRALISS